jgi:hypothetical protein
VVSELTFRFRVRVISACSIFFLNLRSGNEFNNYFFKGFAISMTFPTVMSEKYKVNVFKTKINEPKNLP